MRVDVADDAAAAARRAAEYIGVAARAAVAERGIFTLALSGGRSPAPMLRALAELALPWPAVHLFQVDERVAPAGDAERNFTALQALLVSRAALAGEGVHPMPVEASDLDAAAAEYAAALRAACGDPPILDLVQLGLGGDGHTASLVPGDAALAVADRDVALAGPYQGRRRMTLTFPALRRARCLLWLVTGAEKAPMLARLVAGDASIPAGRLPATNAVVFADRDAAARCPDAEVAARSEP